MGRKRIRPTDDAGLMFVGMDLHKRYTQYAVMDDAGVVVDEGRMENDPDSSGPSQTPSERPRW